MANQSNDVLNTLLTGGMTKNNQDTVSGGIQALMSLLQPQGNPQSANAAIGPSTDAALQKAGIPPEQYDATQQSGPSQESVSQQLQKQVTLKSYTKQLQGLADNTPHSILGALLDNWAAQGGTQFPMASPSGSNPSGSQAQSAQIQVPTGGQSQSSSQPTSGNQSPNASSSSSAQPTDINSQIDNINKQTALNIANRNLSMSQPPNFWQRFGQNFSKMSGGITQADNLANLAAGQKIAGQEPLQPKDIGELNAGSYRAALEATGTALTATQQKLTALTDLYGKEEQNKGPIETLAHTEGANQKVLRQAITDTADNMVTHVKNFRDLIANRPTFNGQGLNQQAQDVNNKISQGKKVGKYTLVNSK